MSGNPNSSDNSAKKSYLRVMTYNIHSGIGMDNLHNNARIIDVLRQLAPDFCSLNEVDIETQRSEFTNIGTEIRTQLGWSAIFAQALPRPQTDRGPGEYGVMGGGRGAFEVMAQLRLPTPEIYEPRTVLILKSCVEHPIYYVVTHLPFEENEETALLRLECLKFIHTYIKQQKFFPAILLGDMNALPDTREINYLRQEWTICNDVNPQCSWPSDHPEMEIDYIAFCPKDSFKVKRCEVVDEHMASDHRPLVVELETAFY